MREYPALLRQAVSLGRRLQDPLIEFAQLCNADEDILCLHYHPLQVCVTLSRCVSPSPGVYHPLQVCITSPGVCHPLQVCITLSRCVSPSPGVCHPLQVCITLSRCVSPSPGVYQQQ